MTTYRLLGRSGLRVFPLSLGTMTFGTTWGVGAPTPRRRATSSTPMSTGGGNLVDTAVNYTDGESERFVGQLIAGKRDRLVVSTKYTMSRTPGDPNSGGNHRLNMMRSVEASLRQLNTDRIDLLYVHAWDFTTSPPEEVMRGLDDLTRAGKVVYVGISDTPAWRIAQMQTLAQLRGWAPLVALQIEYSLVERTVEHELIPMAANLGVGGVMPWSPLGGGVLTGKYTRSDLDRTESAAVSGSRASVIASVGHLTERSLQIAAVVAEVASEIGCTAAQVALAWVLHQRCRFAGHRCAHGGAGGAEPRCHVGGTDLRSDRAPQRRQRFRIGLPDQLPAPADDPPADLRRHHRGSHPRHRTALIDVPPHLHAVHRKGSIMKRTTVGGLDVSAQGLGGCMGMSEYYGVSDWDTNIATIQHAIDVGVTFFDTADQYGSGHNEVLLGRGIAGRRDTVQIATKFGIDRSSGDDLRVYRGDPPYVKRSCDSSLLRLGIDHIDLYYLHRPPPQNAEIEDTVGAMAELVSAGKVRYLGLSEVSADLLRRAHTVHPIAAVQSEYSLWTRDVEHVTPVMAELGIGLVPYSPPLGRGFLTGAVQTAALDPPTDFRARNPRFTGDAAQHNQVIADTVRGRRRPTRGCCQLRWHWPGCTPKRHAWASPSCPSPAPVMRSVSIRTSPRWTLTSTPTLWRSCNRSATW